MGVIRTVCDAGDHRVTRRSEIGLSLQAAGVVFEVVDGLRGAAEDEIKFASLRPTYANNRRRKPGRITF